MSCFICPVCKQELSLGDKSYFCENRHSFDLSKEGYVNLFMSQKSSLKRHGDDKLMVKARRDFLEKGFYAPLQEAICECVFSSVPEKSVVIDVGCGEGYYTKALSDKNDLKIFGIDVSKDALKYAAKGIKNAEFSVASAFDLPFAAKSADCVLNIFAPSAYAEFHRVLKDGGVLVKAVPLEEHLWDLKCALYDEPYKNKPEKRDEGLFELMSVKELRYKIKLTDNSDVQNLFKMTPYYYKTGKNDAEKLFKLNELETVVHFAVEIYKKR